MVGAPADQIVAAMDGAGISLVGTRKIEHGTQVRFENGEIINVYDSGSIVVQGKNREETTKILRSARLETTGDKASKGESAPSKVFIVYGHDSVANDEAKQLIESWGLEPIRLDQIATPGKTIIEKLEKYTKDSALGYALVMATPDDVGFSRASPTKSRFRARQNVVLELGLVLAQLGRAKVGIVRRNVEDFEDPSDIKGVEYLAYEKSVKEVAGKLRTALIDQGFVIK